MPCFLCALLLIAVLAITLKVYLKLTTKWNGCYTTLVGKTAIITGANTGIGFTTALDFAKRGARVILACRNEEKAQDAARKIKKATNNTNVTYKLVDMMSLQSVRAFAEEINKSEDRLDILVNNAGISNQSNDYTDDGIQTILQVNHISGFLLTHLLIDKLKKSAPSRIVNVSSLAARSSSMNIKTLNTLSAIPSGKGLMADHTMYCNSKLCNILFTTELAKRIDGTGVTVNALHPGVIYTEIFRNMVGFLKVLVVHLGRIYFLTPEEGAQTQIYVAVSAEGGRVNGGLFANCKEVKLYESAKDPDLARKVWEKSEELAKLSGNEKILLL